MASLKHSQNKTIAASPGSFTYHSLGRLVRAEDNGIGVRTMSYNDNNWLLRHTNGAQQTVGFDYDGAGRLTRGYEVATPEQSALRPPVEYRFFYDARPDASEGIADATNLSACRTSSGDLKGRPYHGCLSRRGCRASGTTSWAGKTYGSG